MKFLDLGFYQGIFAEVMAKGKKLPVGTIREWKNNKYIKTPTGDWKPHGSSQEKQAENNSKDMEELKKITTKVEAIIETKIKPKEEKLLEALKNASEKDLRLQIDKYGKQYNNAKRIREGYEKDGWIKHNTPEEVEKVVYVEHINKYLSEKTKEESARRKEEAARIKAALPPVTDEMIDKVEGNSDFSGYSFKVGQKEDIKNHLKNGTLKIQKYGKGKSTYYTINDKKESYDAYNYAKTLQEGVEKEQNINDTWTINAYRSGIDALKKLAAGDDVVKNAMYRSELEQLGGTAGISFYWGEGGKIKPDGQYKGGFGFQKIVEKHGIEDAIKVIDTIANGEIGKPYGAENGERVNIVNKDHQTTISLFKDKKSESWVLTGYTIKDNTDAKGRGSDLTSATQTNPIRTRADLGAVLSTISYNSDEKSSEKTIKKSQNGKKMILVMKKRRVVPSVLG